MLIVKLAQHKTQDYSIYQFQDDSGDRAVYYNFDNSTESGYFDLGAMLQLKDLEYQDFDFLIY